LHEPISLLNKMPSPPNVPIIGTALKQQQPEEDEGEFFEDDPNELRKERATMKEAAIG
jgi:hypothetical protein